LTPTQVVEAFAPLGMLRSAPTAATLDDTDLIVDELVSAARPAVVGEAERGAAMVRDTVVYDAGPTIWQGTSQVRRARCSSCRRLLRLDANIAAIARALGRNRQVSICSPSARHCGAGRLHS
jgi:hypothetical protein